MSTEKFQDNRAYLVGLGDEDVRIGLARHQIEQDPVREVEDSAELVDIQKRHSQERERLQQERAQLQQERAQLQQERAQLQQERAQLQQERGDLYRTAERQALEFQKQQELLAAERSRLHKEREGFYRQAQQYFESWLKEVTTQRRELSRAQQELESRRAALDRRERDLRAEEFRLVELGGDVTEKAERVAAELQRISGMTREEAKEELRKQIFEEATREETKKLETLEQRVKEEAEARAARILSTVMQRLAGGIVKDACVREVELPSADFRSRIIGKDGRNIRTFEAVTGVDLIFDEDFPERVAVSSHNPLRREQARMCLEELVADGRIQPKRIEETFERVRRQLERDLANAGREAVAEFGISDMNEELVLLLGKLKLWESAGQNVLEHLRECARLARGIARELSLNPTVAMRAALLHDIGKGLRYELDGPHAIVGAEFARRYGESEDVCHAIEAHHDEVEPKTVEAVLVQVADRLSGGRPGARIAKPKADYVERLEDLEEFCKAHSGVREAYAFKGGREIRVIVDAGAVNDTETRHLARELRVDIQKEGRFPKDLELTVIREYRVTESLWSRNSR